MLNYANLEYLYLKYYIVQHVEKYDTVRVFPDAQICAF